MVRRKQAKPQRHPTHEGCRIETPQEQVEENEYQVPQYEELVRVEYSTPDYQYIRSRRAGVGYIGIHTPDVLREPLRRYLD